MKSPRFHGLKNSYSKSSRWGRFGLVIPGLMAAMGLSAAAPNLEFNRDIRRILSENCFQCHGPDAGGGKAGKKTLRLDLPEAAYARRDGHAAIVPGHPEQSEAIRRIQSKDPDDRMPPPDSGKTLSATDRATLEEWIRQGGTYSQHWAYVAPTRPRCPPSKPEIGRATPLIISSWPDWNRNG